jgi:hypothetical protein
MRQIRYEVPPGLAVARRHALPALGVLQKLPPFLRRKTGELLEGSNALNALRRAEASEGLQRFLDFNPFRFRNGLERLSLFGAGEIKVLIEMPQDFLPPLAAQILPVAQSRLKALADAVCGEFRSLA